MIDEDEIRAEMDALLEERMAVTRRAIAELVKIADRELERRTGRRAVQDAEKLVAQIEVSAGSIAGRGEGPSWLARNKLLTALLLVVLMVMSEPAFARLLPPEVHEFLAQEEGPAAFCMALVAAVTATMAVNKGKKD